MYGLVNRAVEELVKSMAGEESWALVCEQAGVPSQYFHSMDTYPDEITMNLVDAAADHLGLSSDDVLKRFGRYWILYTGAEGWGPILEAQGSTVAQVIANLDNMHARIETAMPEMRAPSFVLRGADSDRIELEYHSERDGLAPMVHGLLQGLAERMNEQWSIEQVGRSRDLGYDVFILRAVVATTAVADPASTAPAAVPR